MQVLYQRCAAVDIGKDVIAVAVRLPGDGPDGRQTMKRTFKTFYGVLAEAARWLTSLGVTHVAMEATGIYSGAPHAGDAGQGPAPGTRPGSGTPAQAGHARLRERRRPAPAQN